MLCGGKPAGAPGFGFEATLCSVSGKQFLEHPDRFAKMAERAHQGIVQHYSFDVRTDKLTQVYERLMGRTS